MSSPRVNKYDDSTTPKYYDSGWFYDSYITDRPAWIQIKVYDESGTLLTAGGDTDVHNIKFEKNINGGLGEAVLDMQFSISNLGSVNTFDFNNRVEFYLTDEFNTDLLIYSGYITALDPYFKDGAEGVKITMLGAISKLSNDYFRVGDSITTTKNSTDPSQIFKDIIDNYRVLEDNPLVNYTGTSIKMTGTSISYTYYSKTHLEAIEKTEEFLPYNWYWYVDADGILNLNEEGQRTHYLSVGGHITSLDTFKNIESIKNKFVFWNGRDLADSDYIYSVYNDTQSQADYDIRTEQRTDSRVTLQATADIMGNSFINANKDPKTRVRLVVNNTYDIASIQPGDFVRIRNVDTTSNPDLVTFPDDLKVVRVIYEVDKVELTLAERGMDIAYDVDQAAIITNNRVGNLEESLTSIPTSSLQIADKEWVTDIIFSEVDHNTVQWTAGTITFADGSTRSISAGNTGNMGAATIIYLDDDLSSTTFQVDTGFQNAVGNNKIAVCITTPAVAPSSPSINPYRAGRGFTWSELDIAVPNLSAINVNCGELTAGIITGLTIRTANATDRVEMKNTQLTVYKDFGGVARVIGAVGYTTSVFVADMDANHDFRGIRVIANHRTGVVDATQIETKGNQRHINLTQIPGAPGTGNSIEQILSSTAGTGYAYECELYGNQKGWRIRTMNNNNTERLCSITNASTHASRTNTSEALYVLNAGTGGTCLFIDNAASGDTCVEIQFQNNSNDNFALYVNKTSTGTGNAIRAVNPGDTEAVYIAQTTTPNACLYVIQNINHATDCVGIKFNITNATGSPVALEFTGSEAGITAAGNGGFVSNNLGTFTLVGFYAIKDPGGTVHYVPYGSIV